MRNQILFNMLFSLWMHKIQWRKSCVLLVHFVILWCMIGLERMFLSGFSFFFVMYIFPSVVCSAFPLNLPIVALWTATSESEQERRFFRMHITFCSHSIKSKAAREKKPKETLQTIENIFVQSCVVFLHRIFSLWMHACLVICQNSSKSYIVFVDDVMAFVISICELFSVDSCVLFLDEKWRPKWH